MGMVQRYQKRIFSPLMDRIDIHLDVKRVPCQKLSALEGGESSPVIRQRMETAHKRQVERFAQLNKPQVLVNGDIGAPGRSGGAGILPVGQAGQALAAHRHATNGDKHLALIRR